MRIARKLVYAILTGLPALAQVSGDPQAIEEGRKLFTAVCAPCHNRGEGARAPDLSSGNFKAGSRDEDLYKVISEGVRGTEMNAFESLGAERIWRLVAYVRSLARVAPARSGDAANGEKLFWGKGDCGRCHSAGSRGGRFGPDLSRSNRRSNAENIRKAITDPDEDITDGYAVIVVSTRDGKTISGLERFYDNFSARLVEPSGTERTFLRSEVNSIRREFRSMMPSNFGQIFTPRELDDLAAYILKLRSERSAP